MASNKIIKDIDQEPILLLPEEEEKLKTLEVLSEWLDDKFLIPGTDIRFGLDAVIGLLPVIGDTISTLLSTYLIKTAHELKAPFLLKSKMAWNVILDWIIGLIPVLGDVSDIYFKANKKNIKLLKDYIKRKNVR